MRKLAHIELIKSLTPIEGADRIEMAKVLGWECVVKKGEFNVGDKVIYIETDSVLPDKPEYEFLRSVKFRIKARKFRGQLSQGLVIPVGRYINYSVGSDVSKELAITKYDPPEVSGDENSTYNIKNKSKFYKYLMRYKWFRQLVKFHITIKYTKKPPWVPTTDEERIQNLPNIVTDLQEKHISVTEKVDGTSASYTRNRRFFFLNTFYVCSRNRTVYNKDSVYWKNPQLKKIKKLLKDLPNKSVVQGELLGPKIQKNKYGYKPLHFKMYNIIVSKKFYSNFEIRAKGNLYGIPTVTEIFKGQLKDFAKSTEELIEKSKGNAIDGNTPREGLIIRRVVDGKKVASFKVINPDFIEKYNL